MKAFLVGAAMLAAVPATAQVNLNTGAPPPPETPTKPQAPDASSAPTPDSPEGPTVTQGTEGTTHSHTVTSGTEGTTETSESGATVVPGTTTASSSPRYTGVGGPQNGDLMGLAGEMLGDQGRVERVMRGSDSSMKASDLLNGAMLTMMQGANRPK